MPVDKRSKKPSASRSLFIGNDTLGDDETNLARYSQLNAKEKARVRAGEKAELEEATSNRYRPLALRAVAGARDFLLNNPLTNDKTRAIIRKENAEASADAKAREKKYQEIKKFTLRSDKERDQELTRYQVNRNLKIDDYPFFPPDPYHKKPKGGSIPGLLPEMRIRADYSSGGAAMKPVDKSSNPGLSKLPSEVRNKMGYMKKGGGMMYSHGGEMMKPVKKAAGGAAKVRKGMATPEGKIIDAMNKIHGK